MSAEALPAPQNLKAAGLAALGFAVFSGTDATDKLMAHVLSVTEVTFMVTGMALVLTVFFTLVTGDADALRPRQPGLATLRGLLLGADTLLIYYAFTRLDLAEAYLLAFLAPALTALLALILLGERVSTRGWLGISLGFCGVLVALRPGVAAINLGHAAAIGSALLFALSLILLRRIKVGESDAALITVLLLVLNVITLGLTLFGGGFEPATPQHFGLAALSALLMVLGHLFLIRAGRNGAAAIVAPFQYSQIIWACLLGLLVFNTPIEARVLVGAGIIILSGWMVLKQGDTP